MPQMDTFHRWTPSTDGHLPQMDTSSRQTPLTDGHLKPIHVPSYIQTPYFYPTIITHLS